MLLHSTTPLSSLDSNCSKIPAFISLLLLLFFSHCYAERPPRNNANNAVSPLLIDPMLLFTVENTHKITATLNF